MPKKKPTVSKLKKKLDAIFSKYIRIRDGGLCFTCNVKKPIKEMQAGHYHRRAINNLRYDEQNVHCQCVGCNMFKEGAKPAYAVNLLRKYGDNILHELEIKSKVRKQWKTFELEEMIAKYTEKVNEYK